MAIRSNQQAVLRLHDTPQLRYKLYRPNPLLSPFVRCYWVLQQDSQTWQRELMLPDGYIDLIFCFAESYRRRELASTGETHINASHIVGQRTRSVFLTETNKLDLLGVKLRPFGLWALANMPASEFYGQIVAVDAFSTILPDLEDRLYNLPTDEARIAQLEHFLAERLLPQQREPALANGIQTLLQSRGTIPIATLPEQLNLSRKTLERHFSQYVGISPKRFARVIRFKATFKHLKELAQQQPQAPMQTHGYLDFGYYDQNHFIKDFKYFMDSTPAVYFGQRFHSSDEFFSMGIENNIAHWLAA